MSKWEYNIFTYSADSKGRATVKAGNNRTFSQVVVALDYYGSLGWELVGIHTN